MAFLPNPELPEIIPILFHTSTYIFQTNLKNLYFRQKCAGPNNIGSGARFMLALRTRVLIMGNNKITSAKGQNLIFDFLLCLHPDPSGLTFDFSNCLFGSLSFMQNKPNLPGAEMNLTPC
jgi:hypothetical protein